MPGTAHGAGGTRLPGSVRVAVPHRIAAGRAVVLGIRPEHPRLDDTGARARVTALEPPLESGIATLSLDGVAEPLAVVTGSEVRLGRDGTVRITADPQHIHVFDAHTGDAQR